MFVRLPLVRFSRSILRRRYSLPGLALAAAVCTAVGFDTHPALAQPAAEAPPAVVDAAAPAPQNQLRVGASGPAVESLQRTLNARMDPSPGLGVDGDFGTITEQALMRFQRAQGLPASGVLDAATQQALGELLSASSETVGAATPLRGKQQEDWNGPPVVSCKAWVIADGDSGKVLFGENHQTQLDNASTTKMMTAWLVAKLANADPTIRQQSLVFSQRADDTIGSTAAIAAGETVVVEDLMYGLMLPSGNDASVAFAEHFGRHFTDVENPTAEQSYDAFIAEMNREAAVLGMTQSGYKNPHGLTDAGHGCSAADLATLAAVILKDRWLGPVVSTRRHAAEVKTAEGGSRRLVWNNTNQLLDIEGYTGLKTGTTNAAGACLVASGAKDGKPLIVVVLGASGSPARYSDSRNLFRWGWGQLSN